jgi:hypothetical protein
MSACRRSYLRYKELCERVVPDESYREYAVTLPRSEELQRLQQVLRDIRRCRNGRENHRQRCIPPEGWDAGHQQQIDQLTAMEEETLLTIGRLLQEPPEVAVPSEVVNAEENIEPVRVASACELASDHRATVCGRIPPNPLANRTRGATSDNELAILNLDLEQLRRATNDCLTAVVAETRACGSKQYDIVPLLQEQKRLRANYERLIDQAVDQTQEYEERMNEALRQPAARKALQDIAAVLETNRKELYNIIRGGVVNEPQALRYLRSKAPVELRPLVQRLVDGANLNFTELGLIISIGATFLRGFNGPDLITEIIAVLEDDIDPFLGGILGAALQTPRNYPYASAMLNATYAQFFSKHGMQAEKLNRAEVLYVLGFLQALVSHINATVARSGRVQ